MTGFLTPKEKRKLKPAETAAFAAPIPTQIVSSDEYFPEPQTPLQRAVEAHIRQFGTAATTLPRPPAWRPRSWR
jgi:hypothetical protein